jgi:hypothetical protein
MFRHQAPHSDVVLSAHEKYSAPLNVNGYEQDLLVIGAFFTSTSLLAAQKKFTLKIHLLDANCKTFFMLVKLLKQQCQPGNAHTFFNCDSTYSAINVSNFNSLQSSRLHNTLN